MDTNCDKDINKDGKKTNTNAINTEQDVVTIETENPKENVRKLTEKDDDKHDDTNELEIKNMIKAAKRK